MRIQSGGTAAIMLKGGGVWLRFLLAVGLFFVMAFMLWRTREGTRPPAIGAERAAFRAESLAETRSAEEAALTSYGIVNAGAGIYRVPIDMAVAMVIKEWKQREEARRRMTERAALAATPPPEEEPSEYE